MGSSCGKRANRHDKRQLTRKTCYSCWQCESFARATRPNVINRINQTRAGCRCLSQSAMCTASCIAENGDIGTPDVCIRQIKSMELIWPTLCATSQPANCLRGDDLDQAGSWATSNDRARYARAATTASPPPPPPSSAGWHRVSTRSWRQLGLRTGPNTYRVSLEEARRFIRAQQQGQASYEMGTMAPALLYARLRAANESPEQQQQQQVATAGARDYEPEQQRADKSFIKPVGVGGEPTTRSRAPVSIREQRSSELQATLSVPKRTELSPEGPFATEGAATTKTTASSSSSSTTTTSGHQLVQETSSSSAPGQEKSRADVMQCNLRSYTYRATKVDGRGNTCTGLITASICYGGCDSGEIADWLFPYKKSIHKVCRHGGRIRRRVLLSECHSVDGVGQQPIDDSLREYHYVDARDCICKKCTGADTNCLGTMTQPHLQTLGETVAELTAADGD